MGFPHKTLAQVQYFFDQVWLQISKNVASSSSSSTTLSAASIYTCNQHKPVFCGLLFIFILIIMEHNSDAIWA